MKTSALIATVVAATFLMQNQPEDSARKIKELRKERIAALEQVADAMMEMHINGQGSLSEVVGARLLLVQAKVEAAETDAERIKLLEKAVEVTREFEAITKAQREQGDGNLADNLKMKARRLEAEITLEQARARAAK